MTWNYRLFKQDGKTNIKDKNGVVMPPPPPFYYVGECYYDDNGEPELHSTMEHNHVCGEDPEETRAVYDMIGEAFKAPVIELDEDGNFKEKS